MLESAKTGVNLGYSSNGEEEQSMLYFVFHGKVFFYVVSTIHDPSN